MRRYRCSAALVAATVLVVNPAAWAGTQGTDPPNPVIPRITVKAEGPARTAEFAEVTITTENLGGSGDWKVDWGDGSEGLWVTQYSHDCGGYSPDTRSVETIPHAYRRAGTWTVTVTFEPDCHGAPLPHYVGTGDVTVTPGRTLANGPVSLVFLGGIYAYAAPKTRPDMKVPPHTMVVNAQYYDYDGYLTRLAFKFGDGSPDRVFTFPLSKCVDPKNHWPQANGTENDPWWGLRHTFPRKGRYRVVVTATTAGCNGRDRQTITGATTAVVGGHGESPRAGWGTLGPWTGLGWSRSRARWRSSSLMSRGCSAMLRRTRACPSA